MQQSFRLSRTPATTTLTRHLIPVLLGVLLTGGVVTAAGAGAPTSQDSSPGVAPAAATSANPDSPDPAPAARTRHGTRHHASTRHRKVASAPVPRSPASDEAPAPSGPVSISILTGGLGSTSSRIASDMSAVLDTDTMRVLPILGKTSLQNLHDLSQMPNIDLAIVRADALQASPPDIRQHIAYVTPLFAEEIHVLAAPRFKEISQLAGQTVAMTGTDPSDAPVMLFKQLNVPVVSVKLDEPAALAKLQAGEVAAVVSVTGKPSQALLDFKNTGGFHLLPIPYATALQDMALPAKLSASDYPNLVPAQTSVETLAVSTVLAVFNAPKGTPRYRRLADFTSAFFHNFPSLRDPARHPKWRDVNLAATVPGWQRFAPARDELGRPDSKPDAKADSATDPTTTGSTPTTIANATAPRTAPASDGFVATADTPFDRFVASRKGAAAGPDGENLSRADQDQLLKEFKIWKRVHPSRSP